MDRVPVEPALLEKGYCNRRSVPSRFKSLLEEPVPRHREELAEGELDVLLLSVFHQSSSVSMSKCWSCRSKDFNNNHTLLRPHAQLHLPGPDLCYVWVMSPYMSLGSRG